MTALNRLILETYILNLFLLIMSLFFVWKIWKFIFSKEKILKKENMQKIAIPFYNKNHIIIDIILVFLMFLWIYITVIFAKRCILDFKNVLEKNYITTQCTIKSEASKNFLSENTISCYEDKEKIKFTYIGDILPVGTIVDISYYKHLQIGQINEIIETNNN